jgi:glycyl-tRNA synthetase
MLLCNGWTEEPMLAAAEGTEVRTRTYLKIPPALAPIKVAIFPLVKKDGLEEAALALCDRLKYDFRLAYEATQSIGKRYARQDLIGTPYCITVDHQTLEDQTITLRERDTMAQQRMPIAEVASFLNERVTLTSLLLQLKA